MAFVLAGALIVLAALAYLRGGRDLLSPWFLLCLATFGTYCLVLLNYENWQVGSRLNLKFVLYLLSAIVAFGAGGGLYRALHPKAARASAPLPLMDRAAEPRPYPAGLMAAVSVITMLGYIGNLLVYAAGAGGSFTDGLRYIYDTDYTPGFFFNQLMEITVALAYISTYKLMRRIYSPKDDTSVPLLLVPPIAALVVCLVSTDRNMFLRYAIFLVCMFVFFYRGNTKKRKPNAAIVARTALILACVAVLFFALGKAKNYTSEFTRALSIYGGSGLFCFNIWLENFSGPHLFGVSTFTTSLDVVSYVLGLLGINVGFGTVPQVDEAITFTAQNGYIFHSNIYTALRPFVQDFGYFGVIIFPFALGAFYEWLYYRARRSGYGYPVIFYSMFVYPVIFFPILEQLFKRLHFGMIYELAWPAIIYFLLFVRRKRRGGRRRKL